MSKNSDVSIKVKIDSDTKELSFSQRELENFGKTINRSSVHTKQFTDRIKDMAHTSVAVYGLKQALDGISNIISKLTSAPAVFETMEATLKTVTGSSQEAKEAMGWIEDFTQNTPFQLDQVGASFVKLKTYGIDPTTGTLRTLGDTASAMHKPVNDAVEALADAMNGEGERLKEFGIKQKVSGDQITYMYTKQGKQQEITISNNREVIKSTLESIWNEKFAGAMKDREQTFDGLYSNMEDNLTLLTKNFSEQTGVFDLSKDAISAISDAAKSLNDPDTIDGILHIAETVGVLGAGLAGAKLSFMALDATKRTYRTNIAPMIVGLKAEAASMSMLTSSTKAQIIASSVLNKTSKLLMSTLKASPFFLVTGAITYMAEAFFDARSRAKEFEGTLDQLDKKLNSFSANKLKLSLEEISISIQDAKDELKSSENDVNNKTIWDELLGAAAHDDPTPKQLVRLEEAKKNLAELEKKQALIAEHIKNIAEGIDPNKLPDTAAGSSKTTFAKSEQDTKEFIDSLTLMMLSPYEKLAFEYERDIALYGQSAQAKELITARYVKEVTDLELKAAKKASKEKGLFDGWYPIVTNTFVNSIQESIDGDFNFDKMASSLSDSLGNALLQSGINSGNLAGVAGGIGLMLLSNIFDQAEMVDTSATTQQLQHALDTQSRMFTNYLTSIGDDLGAAAHEAQVAQTSLDALTTSMGVSGVTMENFSERYAQAVASGLDQDQIELWESLADALGDAADAAQALREAQIDQVQSRLQHDEDLLDLSKELNKSLKTMVDNFRSLAEKAGSTVSSLGAIGLGDNGTIDYYAAKYAGLQSQFSGYYTGGTLNDGAFDEMSAVFSEMTQIASMIGNSSNPYAEQFGESLINSMSAAQDLFTENADTIDVRIVEDLTDKDVRNLSSASFGVGNTLGNQELTDLITTASYSGNYLNRTSAQDLHQNLQAFELAGTGLDEDVSYLNSLAGISGGSIQNRAILKQMQQLQDAGMLTQDQSAALDEVRTNVNSSRTNENKAIEETIARLSGGGIEDKITDILNNNSVNGFNFDNGSVLATFATEDPWFDFGHVRHGQARYEAEVSMNQINDYFKEIGIGARAVLDKDDGGDIYPLRVNNLQEAINTQMQNLRTSITRNQSITAFATGGIVNAPTMGLVGEAGYSEAIIPLKNTQIMENLEGKTNQQLLLHIQTLNSLVEQIGIREIELLSQMERTLRKFDREGIQIVA